MLKAYILLNQSIILKICTLPNINRFLIYHFIYRHPPPTRLHGNLLRGFIITFHYSKHSLYFAEKKPQTGTAMWVVSDICLKSRDINKYPNTRLLPGITDHWLRLSYLVTRHEDTKKRYYFLRSSVWSTIENNNYCFSFSTSLDLQLESV